MEYNVKMDQGSDQVTVQFLRPHKLWAYKEGSITSIARERLSELLGNEEEEIEPYVKIITAEEAEAIFKARAQKTGAPDDSKRVRVKWLRIHPAFAYKPGALAYVSEKNATLLLNEEYGLNGLPGPGPYIKIVPEDYVEHQDRKPVIPDREYITVLVLKAHPEFSYSAGDIGCITPENFQKLSAGGFVTAKPNPKQSFLDKLFKR